MGGSAWARRIRSDPSQNKNIKQFYAKQKIGGKVQRTKKSAGQMMNNTIFSTHVVPNKSRIFMRKMCSKIAQHFIVK
jgi:hypothetical protein